MTTENTQVDPNVTPDAAALAATAAAAEAAAKAAPATPLEVSLKPDANSPEALAAAAKAAEEAKGKKGDEPQPVVYNPTGDTGLDMTLKFVGDLGYGPDHPAMSAAIEGDFSLLEAELASKGVKGYEAYIKLGQKAYTEVSTKTKERQASDKAAVEKIAGSAEDWAAATKWAGSNADDSEKAALKEALGKGGLQAQMAATWLMTHYQKANNVSTEGAGREVAASKGASASATGALDPKAYGAAVMEARRNHKGGDFETSQAYKDLSSRRMAWRA